MKTYYVYDIEYELDGTSISEDELPKDTTIFLDTTGIEDEKELENLICGAVEEDTCCCCFVRGVKYKEVKGEPITDESTLTRERLFMIAEELIAHLWEAIGDTKETYTVLTDCIGLTETEIEELTSGEIPDDEKRDDE